MLTTCAGAECQYRLFRTHEGGQHELFSLAIQGGGLMQEAY